MRRLEISEFLQHAAVTAALADKVRAAMFTDSDSRSISRHVGYTSLAHHPTSFAADLLHIRYIAKLEYVRLKASGREFLAAQYVFSHLSGKEEVKLQQALQFVHPGMVLLPDGNEIRLDADYDESVDARQIKDAVSTLLLSDALNNLQVWNAPT